MTEIIELNKNILEEKSNSYLITLKNFKWYKNINKKKLIEYFRKMENNSKVFVALNEEKEIIWSITILIEYKLIRDWFDFKRIELNSGSRTKNGENSAIFLSSYLYFFAISRRWI